MAFFCQTLHVSRQGFYQYLATKDHPWKYQPLADAMKEILEEDECNDTYGRIRMYQALLLKQPEHVEIPSERTVYRVMEKIGISHHPRRKPNGITKADREARKSDDLLKRDFHAEGPLTKCVTDIFIAINFILSFLLTSDGSRRKKRWLPPKSRFLSSNAGFLFPAPSPVGGAG